MGNGACRNNSGGRLTKGKLSYSLGEMMAVWIKVIATKTVGTGRMGDMI